MTPTHLRPLAVAATLLLSVASAACSSDGDASPQTGAGDASATAASNAQTPPVTVGADVESWLAAGAYTRWHCEAAPHASRDPSPHGINRICSNDLAHGFTGTGERPEGTAAVKELYDAAGKTVVGYAVYVKTKAASEGGKAWYWYERVPSDSAAPHDAKGVVADGLGATGTANSICVGCHAAAGSDAAHTPSPGGSDEVYTQVP